MQLRRILGVSTLVLAGVATPLASAGAVPAAHPGSAPAVRPAAAQSGSGDDHGDAKSHDHKRAEDPRDDDKRDDDKSARYSFAVIGDVPYGADQLATFPSWIKQTNEADPATFHVGDIKNGSDRCDNAYYTRIKRDFNRFDGPLIDTPGDKEWTDCHRPSNGAYNPLERLAYDRSAFFQRPGTLGEHPAKVASQAAAGFPRTSSCAGIASTSPCCTSSAATTTSSRGPASA